MSLARLLAATVHCLWAAAGGRQDEAKWFSVSSVLFVIMML